MSDQRDQRPPFTTTDAGIPAPSDEYSLSVGPQGPLLLQDHYLIQKMAQFNRERVPERVVHAKGSGAFGYFEVTEDVTQLTKAAFLNKVGKRTPVLARFSTVAGELGSADTVRDPRGFALKFYTEEGNYDMVGNNTPIFFVRDPSKFQDFIQPGNLYRHVLSEMDREHLVSNIVGHMSQDVERPVQERAVRLWYQVDSDLGVRIARGLGLETSQAAYASADGSQRK